MGTRLTKKAVLLFDSLKRADNKGNEYWSSRELAKALTYTDYRNFLTAVGKAKQACENTGINPADHFVEANEMVAIGSGAERQIDTIYLSRYACYLVVQNADPSKTIVAQGQTYFAIQTRLSELRQAEEAGTLTTEEERRLFLRGELSEHNSKLASAAKDAGVIDSRDYAIFQNYGYKGLYGGLDAKDIHARKGLKKSQKILDQHGQH